MWLAELAPLAGALKRTVRLPEVDRDGGSERVPCSGVKRLLPCECTEQ